MQTVGPDDHPGADLLGCRSHAGDVPCLVAEQAGRPCAFAQGDQRLITERVDEDGVEPRPADPESGRRAAAGRRGKRRVRVRGAPRALVRHALDGPGAGLHDLLMEPEAAEHRDARWHQAFAARLVARKPSAIEHEHTVAPTSEQERRRRATRARADDGDVRLHHACTLAEPPRAT